MAALSAFLLIREAGTRMAQRGMVSVDQSEAFILTIYQSQGTILVTGATASTRGAAGFSAFSSAKVNTISDSHFFAPLKCQTLKNFQNPKNN